MMETNAEVWWGNYAIKIGASAQWEFPRLHIGVQRLAHEWVIAYETTESDNDEGPWRFSYSDLDLDQSQFSSIARYVFRATSEQLTILPLLADRAVVSRPYTQFTVPAGEATTIFVGTPLWFALAGEPGGIVFEIPIRRPSDTWFGPSTREGELAYASRTSGRLNLENITVSPYVAITEVHIHNGSSTPLLVERLNLPVPFLSLFQTEEGNLYTERVTFEQTEGTSLTKFHMEEAHLALKNGAKLIARPRQSPHKGMLVRAFEVLKLQGF
jgi:hypothetical protein